MKKGNTAAIGLTHLEVERIVRRKMQSEKVMSPDRPKLWKIEFSSMAEVPLPKYKDCIERWTDTS